MITLQKAIEILAEVKQNPRTAIRMDFPEASQLGIEALKRIKYLQSIALYRADTTLPGETKE